MNTVNEKPMQDLRIGTLFICAILVTFCACKDDPPAESDGSCPAGTEDCPCRDDGTCSTLGGVQMVCSEADVCQLPGAQPGELNGSCGDEVPCASFDGEELTCVGDVCQISDCLSGVLNCPCAAGDSCDDDTASCQDAYCRLDECEAGSAGCACGEGDVCEGELECRDGFCQAGVEFGLRISGDDVRSCEIMIDDPSQSIAAIRFGATVMGHHRPRDVRLAVAVLSRSDSAFADGSITIQLKPGVTAADAGLSVAQQDCFDRAGEAVDGAAVSIE